MTIGRGTPWGEPVRRPDDLVVASDDAALAALVADRPGRYGIASGDLFRSVGSPPARTDAQLLSVDAIEVVLDGEPLLAVAHVVIRRPGRLWWLGQVIVIANADHIGTSNVAPRAHPNDGRLDVLEFAAELTLRERLQIRSRLALGAHVPHPKIAVTATAGFERRFDRPQLVVLDGGAPRAASHIVAECRPDHFAIVV